MVMVKGQTMMKGEKRNYRSLQVKIERILMVEILKYYAVFYVHRIDRLLIDIVKLWYPKV